jgi:hypothetical protein
MTESVTRSASSLLSILRAGIVYQTIIFGDALIEIGLEAFGCCDIKAHIVGSAIPVRLHMHRAASGALKDLFFGHGVLHLFSAVGVQIEGENAVGRLGPVQHFRVTQSA